MNGFFVLVLMIHGYREYGITTIPETYQTIEQCKHAGSVFVNEERYLSDDRSFICIPSPRKEAAQ